MKFYEPDSRYWKIIESLGYGEGKLDDYDPYTVKAALVRLYTPETLIALREFIYDAYCNLYKAVESVGFENLEEITGRYISDDGLSDLIYHVVGSGSSVYHDVLNNPKEALKDYKYEECFSYYIPYESEISSHREYDKLFSIDAWNEDLYALIGVLTVLKNSDEFPELDAKYATGSLIDGFVKLFTEIIEEGCNDKIANFFKEYSKSDYDHLGAAFDSYWVPNVISDLKRVHFSELPELEEVI